ncbi:SPOR domain-containing protein [Acidobacterium sp. S8]|uniref:SPOR domain-containing protein n=1 Tax=Acidobacterium sp. S8 TaxID=1641854 RepID=UPI00131E2115|nr:SPOR domain-containing protein [Acidobacterium sp. S8]
MRSVIDDEEEKTDSEITLNATTLLGIFFGLVLVCGVFFGFGYSIGRRGTDTPSASAPAASSATEDTPTPSEANATKPSAMESLQAAESDQQDANTVTQSVNAESTSNKASAPQVRPALLTPSSAPKPSPVSATPAEAKPASLPITTAANESMPAAGSASIMVQIAAVTHQEDANVLISALRQRGYSVSVRNEPQDKLLHIQIGPFASRDAAKAMRSRLQADGYNAILKQ